MNKKSQSISINTIIIAAIALAVLVVLFIVFTGRFKIFSEGVSKTTGCETACKSFGKIKYSGGDVRRETCEGPQASISGGIAVPGRYDDVTEGFVCCCV